MLFNRLVMSKIVMIWWKYHFITELVTWVTIELVQQAIRRVGAFLKKLPSTLTYVFHSKLIVYYIDKIQNNAMPSLLLHIITICSLICYFMILNEWLNSFVWFLLSVIILGNVAKFPLRIFPTNTWIWKPSIPHFEIISTVPLYCHNMS